MVQHGSTNLTDTNRSLFPVGTVLQYSCQLGYLLDGPSILSCSTQGHWSSEPPRCIHSNGKNKSLKSTIFISVIEIVLMQFYVIHSITDLFSGFNDCMRPLPHDIIII